MAVSYAVLGAKTLTAINGLLLMMNFTLETRVRGHFLSVFGQMNRDIFDLLPPPVGRVEVLRYEGEQPGNVVEVVLHLPLLPPQPWRTDMVAREVSETEAFFTDAHVQGPQPFFLRAWRHTHRVVADGPDHSRIRDEIFFAGPWWIPGIALYAVLWVQFAARRPRYRAIFGV